MRNDWNWHGEDETRVTVIQPVQAVVVYRNDNGAVVIRQQDPLGDEDDVVVIPRAQLEPLIAALQAEHGNEP